MWVRLRGWVSCCPQEICDFINSWGGGGWVGGERVEKGVILWNAGNLRYSYTWWESCCTGEISNTSNISKVAYAKESLVYALKNLVNNTFLIIFVCAAVYLLSFGCFSFSLWHPLKVFHNWKCLAKEIFLFMYVYWNSFIFCIFS